MRGASQDTPDAAPDAGSAGCSAADSSGTSAPGDGGAVYSGSVVASWTTSGTLLSAGFPNFGGGYAAAVGTGTTCNCVGGVADPAPSASAGTVTVQSAPCGPVLATLVFASEGGFAQYAQSHASWTPGDALFVSAPGVPSQVHAFAGFLRTGVPISGLSPGFGPTAQDIVVRLDQPLVVSWTPEAKTPSETVLVGFSQVTTSSIVECGCFALDSEGTLTVPAGLLSQHFVASASGANRAATASATRIIDTQAGADDALVDLIGVVGTGGPIVFE